MVWKRIIILLTCTTTTRGPLHKRRKLQDRKYRLAGTHIDTLCKRTRIQRRWKNTCKLKEECGFLHFLTHSKNIAQSKNFLHQLLSKHQYTVLKELVINDLAGNLPTYGSTKKKAKLRKSLKKRLEHLARGQYHKTTCLSSFPTYNCLLFTPYDSMASVSKLVPMPIDMWHRLSKDRKDIDVHSIKTVDISSSANQSGAGGSANALPLPDPPALPEGLAVVGASSLSPPSLPPSPPLKEKGQEEEGGTHVH